MTEISPLAVLFANIPSAVLPITTPEADIDKLPVPASSALMPLDDPVTAFAVIVIVVPLTVFLANIPCLPVLDPVTAPLTSISIAPVAVLSA